MCKPIIRFALATIAVLFCDRPDAGTYGSVYLYGSGLNANLESDSAFSYKEFTYDTTTYRLLEPNTFTSYFPVSNGNGGYDAASITSSAAIKNEYGNLGLSYTITMSAPDPYSTIPDGDARIIREDEIYLRWTKGGTAPILPSHELDATWNLDGKLGFNADSGAFGGSSSVYAGLSSNYLTYTFDRDNLLNLNGQTTTVSVAPSVRFNIDANGHSSFDPMLGLRITPGLGMTSQKADLEHTMSLKSITFPDGTTPESHGWAVEFSSGASSPNISSVPEPSSMLLCSIGATVMTWMLKPEQTNVFKVNNLPSCG